MSPTSITVRQARLQTFASLIEGGLAGLSYDEIAGHAALRNWPGQAVADALADALAGGLVVVIDGRVQVPNEIEGQIDPGFEDNVRAPGQEQAA